VLDKGRLVADGRASDILVRTSSDTINQAFSKLTGIVDIRSGGKS
jgi:ABC-2 type transport system ATP-binding protein